MKKRVLQALLLARQLKLTDDKRDVESLFAATLRGQVDRSDEAPTDVNQANEYGSGFTFTIEQHKQTTSSNVISECHLCNFSLHPTQFPSLSPVLPSAAKKLLHYATRFYDRHRHKIN